MKLYYLAGFATTYIVSYLIFHYIYKTLNIEKLISQKTSIRISLFIIAALIGGGIFSIIDSLNIAKGCQMLIKGLFFGSIVAFIISILPRNKHQL